MKRSAMGWISRFINALLACTFVAAVSGCGGMEEPENVLEAYRMDFPNPEGYEIVIGYVSGDDNGESLMEVAVLYGGKKVASERLSVLNGGERGLYSVEWQDEYVLIVLWGSQMSGKIYLTVEYDTPSRIAVSDLEPAATPVAVDLGLSVLWASMNVGGAAEYKHGYHYLWSTSVSSRMASVLGPGWRLPTTEEFRELIDNCQWRVLKSADVDGYELTGRKPGHYDDRIFLPFSGYKTGEEVRELRLSGGYWSSTTVPEPGSDMECPIYLSIKGSKDAYGMMTNAGIGLEVMSTSTTELSVRPVMDK